MRGLARLVVVGSIVDRQIASHLLAVITCEYGPSTSSRVPTSHSSVLAIYAVKIPYLVSLRGMKFPLPADTFPTLALSSEEQQTIEDAAEEIIKNAIKQYLEHLTVDSGVVDEKRWKKIKQREDVRVYRERKTSINETTSVSSGPSAEESTTYNLKSMTTMLTFGSIQGNLDDVMYGIVSPTTEEMQLKTAYVEDGMKDWDLLALIIKPSEQDPFRELSLKWTVKRHPLLLGAVLHSADVVYMESCGIARTPNGERIGYHLYHSVDLPEIRELNELNIVRAKFSACEFFRQRKENSIEVYARSVLIPMDDIPKTLLSLSASEAAVAVLKHVYYAEMKKLTRMVCVRQRSLTNSKTDSLSSLDIDSTDCVPVSEPAKTCAVCSQKVGGGLSFAFLRDKSCRICLARVCSHCRVHKTIYFPTEVEKQLVSMEMGFCTRCIQDATHTSSAKFAALDALAVEGKIVDYFGVLR